MRKFQHFFGLRNLRKKLKGGSTWFRYFINPIFSPFYFLGQFLIIRPKIAASYLTFFSFTRQFFYQKLLFNLVLISKYEKSTSSKTQLYTNKVISAIDKKTDYNYSRSLKMSVLVLFKLIIVIMFIGNLYLLDFNS